MSLRKIYIVFLVQIKSQLKQEEEQEMILFNNNEILIDANLS